jgi:hypothetical protein
MTSKQKLERWLKARRRLGLNVRQVAESIGVHQAMAYAWNCGARDIPPARVIQLEQMVAQKRLLDAQSAVVIQENSLAQ